MHIKRPSLALLLTLITTGVCLAQSSAEFGRASGGLIELSMKAPTRFSGSLGLTTGGLRGYGATLGGTIVNDRLWFFGTAERNETRVIPRLPQTAPQLDANWNAALGSRNSFAAFLRNGQAAPTTIPSSFLSLRYTGIVSSNMFITGTVSRTP